MHLAVYVAGMQLDLNDLKPVEATFETSEGHKLTLKKFSLAAQIWANERFGEERIKAIFEDRHVGDVSEIAYYLLKEKAKLPTLQDFREAIVTQKDKIALITALMATVGISQPMIENLGKEFDVKKAKPSEPTGQNITT